MAQHLAPFAAWRLLRRLRRAWPRGGALALRLKPPMVSSEAFVAGGALASRLDREASGVLPVASEAARDWLQASEEEGRCRLEGSGEKEEKRGGTEEKRRFRSRLGR